MRNEVIEYYDQCHTDYQLLWGVNRNFSFHYGFYDKNHRHHNEALINMNRVLAKMIHVMPGDKILDAGCGIGGSAIWLAKNFNTKVIGINISNKQIEIAKKLVRQNNIENLVNFYVKDFIDTNFPKNSFDVIWGIESICHARNKKDFLFEAKRILKNGGRLIIADGFLKKKERRSGKKEMRKWLSGWAVPNLAEIKEFQKYLEELNFKNIKFQDIKENIMLSSKRMYLASIFAYPIGRILEWTGLRTKTQTANIISAYYQYKTLKKDLWTYGIFYAEK